MAQNRIYCTAFFSIHKCLRRVSILSYTNGFRYNDFISSSHTNRNLASYSAPRNFPISGFELLSPTQEVEEESIPTYKAERFYPARLGEVFEGRYQAVRKLGYGSTSTVWLCRDLYSESEYVALKIYTSPSPANREIAIYKHLDSVDSEHAGKGCIRKLLDFFEISGPYGNHTVLVHQPLGISLHDFMSLLPDRSFSKGLLRPSMKQILVALDYLHTEAHIVHTDLQAHNILLGIKDNSVFLKYDQSETDRPVARKILDYRTIYLSRPLPITKGLPLLCDLGEARHGD